MEGIIIVIIMGILGSLFSKNKQKDQKPMPPFNNKPNTTTFDQQPMQNVEPKKTTARTLEDFAKEIFEQLSEKTNAPQEVFREPQNKNVPREPKVEQVLTTISNKSEQPVTKKIRETRPELDENRSSKRNDQPQIKDPIKQNEIGSFVPNTKQALVQAIIASEIIGPPKAKQR